jgi:HEAT repeat protein
MTPKERVRSACARHGETEVAAWCAGLLSGTLSWDDPESLDLVIIGGPHATTLIAAGGLTHSAPSSTAPSFSAGALGGKGSGAAARLGATEAGVHDYWVRVWAARAFLYAWRPFAAPAVVGALADPAWRVREMALKVIRLRELGEAADLVIPLTEDEVARVRAAAVRALALVGEAEHAPLIHTAADDPDSAVRSAAQAALAKLATRLDRPI